MIKNSINNTKNKIKDFKKSINIRMKLKKVSKTNKIKKNRDLMEAQLFFHLLLALISCLRFFFEMSG